MLTDVIREGRLHCDVINVRLRCGVQQDRSVYSSVVEEIKVSVLNEVASRVSERKRRCKDIKYLGQEIMCLLIIYCSFPVAQMVEHGASNAKIMGSIPRESKS